MAKMASDKSIDEFRDCYFLTDDATFNAKVRDNTLKIKELVAEKKGFERWASGRYQASDDVPTPFDVLFDELKLERPQNGKKYDLEKAIDKLDPKLGVRSIFVTKTRRRYQIGSVLAEVTDIEIDDSGDVLRTLAIEGDDLEELVSLRKKLGLRDEENVAMHQVVDEQHD